MHAIVKLEFMCTFCPNLLPNSLQQIRTVNTTIIAKKTETASPARAEPIEE